jgi:hypothetical protein
MQDLLGKAVIEARSDATVAAITDRIRAHKPGPDDANGPGEFIPFAVLSDLGGPPLRRVPVQILTIGVRAYGVTPQGAKALYIAISNAFHDEGPRKHGTVGIYRSADISGGSEGEDPRTHQPYVDGVIELIATTSAVAA